MLNPNKLKCKDTYNERKGKEEYLKVTQGEGQLEGSAGLPRLAPEQKEQNISFKSFQYA